MSSVFNDTRAPFFPNSRSAQAKANSSRLNKAALPERNSFERSSEIKKQSRNNVNVDIPESVKDFARIRSAVDNAGPIDKTARIQSLRDQIQSGTYEIDYDALADRMLQESF